MKSCKALERCNTIVADNTNQTPLSGHGGHSFEPRQEAIVTGLESCGLAAEDTETFLSGFVSEE